MHCKCAEHCAEHEIRRCIIVDNIEHIAMHQDMSGLVRMEEWNGMIILIQSLLLQVRAGWRCSDDDAMQGIQ